MGVTHKPPVGAGTQIVATLGEAVQAWNTRPAGTLGIIALMDSHTYREDLVGPLAVRIPAGSRLLLVAAGWPEDPDAPGLRIDGLITPTGLRPHLLGALEVVGAAPAGALQPGAFTLNGLLVEGTVTVLAGNLGELGLAHCTLVPGSSSLSIKMKDQMGQRNESLSLGLDRSICGPLLLPKTIRSAGITDSIIDGDLSGPMLEVRTSTVLGATQATSLEASNSIFEGVVAVERRQTGCVRFCYLPPGSQAPRRYRCQPADAASAEHTASTVPTFASTTYGEPDYGQLTGACPPEIAAGAEDEGEMGAYHFLQAPQRLKNLRVSLDEYLRFGLEAGVFFAS